MKITTLFYSILAPLAVLSLAGILTAIPMYFLWNWLVPIYLYQLPPIYKHISFFHVLGIIWLITFIRGLLFPIKPKS
jgi:hypothetical protein